MDYRDKVALLRQYKDAVRLVKYYQEELNQYRETQEQAKSQIIDDMPHAHGSKTDLSDYMVKIDEMTGEMYSHLIKAENLKSNIMVWASTLANVNERLVIMYHYIQGHTFGWIADEMTFSEKTIRRIRNKAIEHLPDPDVKLWIGYDDGKVVL